MRSVSITIIPTSSSQMDSVGVKGGASITVAGGFLGNGRLIEFKPIEEAGGEFRRG